MITQITLDNVFSAIKVVDIIGPHVDLKKSGKSYKGKCPFHDESDASFTVSSELNIYKCFGCGKAGNGINFLMDYKSYSFPEAIKEVANYYSIEIIEDDLSDEEQAKQRKNELFFELYNLSADYFHQNLFKPDNAIALEYALSRFSMDQIDQFQIGYSSDDWHELFSHLLKHSDTNTDLLVESKLINRHENGRCYDFFRNRLMFPVWNSNNRVISFGGRILPNSEGPKYLNTSNSPIYNKSKALYLHSHAKKTIRETSTFYLVEGYTDAITLHNNGITNAVAPCGTALTGEQIQMLKRDATTAFLVYDSDTAGSNAAFKNASQLISAGFIVKIVTLPDGKDPDEYFNSTSKNLPTLKSLSKDFLYLKSEILAKSITDPLEVNDAVNYLIKLIACYPKKATRTTYIEQCAKRLKTTQKKFFDELNFIDANAVASSPELDSLPDGVDVSDYDKYGFYEYNHEYWFRNGNGSKNKYSNFTMKPLFHVISINDTRRIYELTNFRGLKKTVDFDMQEMVSITNFKKHIEGAGNYVFYGQEQHMSKLKLKLYDQTRTAYEVPTLGWQQKGFFAWSNGMVDMDGTFTEVDEDGLINFNNEYYFIPAFSKIYIDDRSLYIDERKFKYIKSDISLKDWSEKFINVFADNAKLGIAFYIAAIFRDVILHRFSNFPILNLFGPKGTGKSQMAMSLSCLFGLQQTPFNIHNGTKPGLAEHVQQFVNAFAWIDEYKNNIEYDKIETLKAIYDAIGRNRLNMDKGKKKETTLVNSAVILSGQEMPTADVALFSRVLFLRFNQTEFSQDEIDNYEDLKNIEKKGLSHLTSQILAHRKYFEENFHNVYNDVVRDINSELEDFIIEGRILKSFCSILAAYKTIADKLSLNMDYASLRSIAIQSIKTQNSQITSSNEISMFWGTVEALFDENEIIDNWHFKVDMCSDLNLNTGKHTLAKLTNVLMLKFTTIYKSYATHSRRSGQGVLPNSTLRYYLENSPHFLGVARASRFTLKEYSDDKSKFVEKNQITTAYCFDYDKLGINMIRNTTSEDSLTDTALPPHAALNNSKDSNDSMPF